jgi:hypothetical protein
MLLKRMKVDGNEEKETPTLKSIIFYKENILDGEQNIHWMHETIDKALFPIDNRGNMMINEKKGAFTIIAIIDKDEKIYKIKVPLTSSNGIAYHDGHIYICGLVMSTNNGYSAIEGRRIQYKINKNGIISEKTNEIIEHTIFGLSLNYKNVDITLNGKYLVDVFGNAFKINGSDITSLDCNRIRKVRMMKHDFVILNEESCIFLISRNQIKTLYRLNYGTPIYDFFIDYNNYIWLIQDYDIKRLDLNGNICSVVKYDIHSEYNLNTFSHASLCISNYGTYIRDPFTNYIWKVANYGLWTPGFLKILM